jgi:hypothetical protein
MAIQNLAKDTSRWTEDVLPRLRIRVAQENLDMYNVFLGGTIHFMSDTVKCAKMMRMLGAGNTCTQVDGNSRSVVTDCYRHVFHHIFTFNYEDVSNIRLEELREVERELMDSNWKEDVAERFSGSYQKREKCKV